MRTSHALLLLAAVGAVRIVQSERHQWQQNQVAVTELQHARVTHLISHPHLAQDWAPEGMTKEEFARLLSENAQLVSLSLRHRLGLLRGSQLRFVADAFMARPAGRLYWRHFGPFRTQEADGDRCAERFTAALEDAYVAHPDTDPIGV
ncbi:DUF6082 family protein [Streptomyces noursei]|uniref:DUF6082 family protein n=1 Tax=Streptomyces noursei TaxID=1971 RepID=UPI00045EFDD1|nr:DUF6082 family protein [Streptomyces noursei]AIA06719.1 spore associated protein, SapC [Streptomyces noursei]